MKMTTKEAFKELCDNWKTTTHPNKEKAKIFKYKFLHGISISEDKMKQILIESGWKIKSELTWVKPK